MYTAKQPGATASRCTARTPSVAQALVASRETSALFQALPPPAWSSCITSPSMAWPPGARCVVRALARIRYTANSSCRRLPAGSQQPPPGNRIRSGGATPVDADLSSLKIPPGSGVSINLSAQSISRPEIVSQLLELSRHGTRHALMLEITETSLITQMIEVRTYLDLLHTVNYRIAMDDFGTGYSPLRYLVDLPVDVVKFDISL